MKRNIFIAGALFICFGLSVQVQAQTGYSVVYELYYNLTLYPERGDNLIHQNKGLFNSRFYSCLSIIQQRAERLAREHTAKCNGYIDPNARARCEQNNEGAKFWTWTRRVRSVCRGEISWSRTDVGQATIIGKRTLESLNPGQYENIVRKTIPNWRSFLICQ